MNGSYGSYSTGTCQLSHRDDPESTPLNRRGPAGLPPSFPPRPRASSQLAVAPPAGSPTSTPHGAPNLEAIVKIAHEEGHSDVHLGVGEVPRYRSRGEMQSTEWPATDLSTFQGWLHEILSPQQIDAFLREKEFNGSHAFPFVRIRINLLDLSLIHI